MSDSADDDYSTLKPSLRRAIDTAFLRLTQQRTSGGTQPVKKKQRIQSKEDGVEYQGEGAEDQGEDSTIPLSLVPAGLQMLDLAPDDPEVLAVFRNGATGWETRPRGMGRRLGEEENQEEIDEDAGLVVSKEDWRAVCAVLVGQRNEGKPLGRRKKPAPEPGPSTSESKQTRRLTRARAKIQTENPADREEDEGGGFEVDRPGDNEPEDEGGGFARESDDDVSDSDTYSEPPVSDESTSSEFGAPARPKASGAGKVAEDTDSELSLDDEDDGMLPSLTARQEREARAAFALFFPEVDVDDPLLETKKIGIREVGDAAKTLKEKLLTDDIVEMLSMFSSGPSGTIGLEEFSRMAVMAKLV